VTVNKRQLCTGFRALDTANKLIGTYELDSDIFFTYFNDCDHFSLTDKHVSALK